MPQFITLTGDLGSGKSSIAKELVRKLNMQKYSTGAAQRRIADKRGVTTTELNLIAEKDPTIDKEIDSVFKDLANQEDDYIVDSRLAWHFLPESFKVYLAVDPLIAAERIVNDETRDKEKYQCVEDALKHIVSRRESEVTRFQRVYGIDITEPSNFDLVINTSNLALEDAVKEIIMSFKAFKKSA